MLQEAPIPPEDTQNGSKRPPKLWGGGETISLNPPASSELQRSGPRVPSNLAMLKTKTAYYFWMVQKIFKFEIIAKERVLYLEDLEREKIAECKEQGQPLLNGWK